MLKNLLRMLSAKQVFANKSIGLPYMKQRTGLLIICFVVGVWFGISLGKTLKAKPSAKSLAPLSSEVRESIQKVAF